MNYIEIDETANLTPGALKLLQAIEAAVQIKIGRASCRERV